MGHFYRASNDEWRVGLDLAPRQKRPYDHFDQPEVERVLEAACTDSQASRLGCYFSFPHAPWAVGFYVTQGRSAAVTEKHTGKLSLYLLESESWRLAPYALVYQISLMLQSDQRSVAEALAREYWHPDDKWSFPEALLPAAHVIGIEDVQLDLERAVEEAKRALEPDRQRARERVVAVGGRLVSPFSSRP